MRLPTFNRRKKSTARPPLSAEQSDKIWRFAKIFVLTADVLGSENEAVRWLDSPAMGLNNKRPIDLLGSTVGAEAVEDYLMRMDYGIYI